MLKAYAQDTDRVKPWVADGGREVYDWPMKAARSSGMAVLLALVACTGHSAEPEPQLAPSPLPAQSSVASENSCTKADIPLAIEHFIRAWNHGSSAALKKSLSPTAHISVWVLDGANTVDDAGAGIYETSAGWPENRALMKHQHAVGQRLSFERLQVIGRRGAYAVGMRTMYGDGTAYHLRAAKFAYSCNEHALERVVLVAPER
jgi:hypothetical protein